MCINCDSARKRIVHRHISGGMESKIQEVCINEERWDETPHRILPANAKTCQQYEKRQGGMQWMDKNQKTS